MYCNYDLVIDCMATGSVYTDDDEESGGSSRAQYVSANCVVFTHYTGDVAAVVDEHFTRALATDTKPITANSKGQLLSSTTLLISHPLLFFSIFYYKLP